MEKADGNNFSKRLARAFQTWLSRTDSYIFCQEWGPETLWSAQSVVWTNLLMLNGMFPRSLRDHPVRGKQHRSCELNCDNHKTQCALAVSFKFLVCSKRFLGFADWQSKELPQFQRHRIHGAAYLKTGWPQRRSQNSKRLGLALK